MLKIDIEEVYRPVCESEQYKAVEKEFLTIIDKLPAKEKMVLDDAVSRIEFITIKLAYRKAFHDGMRFILNAMSGKEVIEL